MAYVIAAVGAGGKTTLIRKLAAEYRLQGKKVFVTTSTHMYKEAHTLVTDCADEILEILEKERYVMAGKAAEGAEQEKIQALSATTYLQICEKADIVLIEADGSKHKPLKVPADYEPVIYDNVNEIIVVCGLHALGKKAGDVIHRFELARKLLSIEAETEISEDHVKMLLERGYVKRLSESFPEKMITVYASHDGSEDQRTIAERMHEFFNRK